MRPQNHPPNAARHTYANTLTHAICTLAAPAAAGLAQINGPRLNISDYILASFVPAVHTRAHFNGALAAGCEILSPLLLLFVFMHAYIFTPFSFSLFFAVVLL